MSKHILMSYKGHEVIEIDRTNEDAVKEAMDRFHALVKEGHTAATRKAGGGEYTMIKSPDQEQDETLFVPHMQGG